MKYLQRITLAMLLAFTAIQVLAAPVIQTIAVPTTAANVYALLPGGSQLAYREIVIQNNDATYNVWIGSSSGITASPTGNAVKLKPGGGNWVIRANTNSLQARSYWIIGDQPSGTINATFAGEYQ